MPKGEVFQAKWFCVHGTWQAYQATLVFMSNVETVSRIKSNLWLLQIRESLCDVPIDLCQQYNLMVYSEMWSFWFPHSAITKEIYDVLKGGYYRGRLSEWENHSLIDSLKKKTWFARICKSRAERHLIVLCWVFMCFCIYFSCRHIHASHLKTRNGFCSRSLIHESNMHKKDIARTFHSYNICGMRQIFQCRE